MVAEAAQVIERTDETSGLTERLAAQRRAFEAAPYPALSERRAKIKALRKAVVAREADYLAAVAADFGSRHGQESVVSELLVFAETARYVCRHLRQWMKPERRRSGLLMAGTFSSVVYQPLGVVGILAPWNYPFLMVMRPLLFALAAGNRVMIKPSEVAPRSAAFVESVIRDVFDATEVAVVHGDAGVAAAFTQLPFDHILFTGSTNVGRHVMRAAAENLTPVTLELGGKSPAVIGEDVNLAMVAERLVFAKSLNAGQTCVAPDYALVPRGRQAEFVAALARAHARMFPADSAQRDFTSVINERMYGRVRGLIDDAKEKGADVVVLGTEDTDHPRRQPLTLISNLSADMRVMSEEIFGPILPIVPYDSRAEVVDFINSRGRPLALNLFGRSRAFQREIIEKTHSGAVSINDAVTYVGVDDLPFGGVGHSGMGRYAGKEGFLTYSNAKAVFRRPTLFNSAKLLHAPYGRWPYRLVRKLFLR